VIDYASLPAHLPGLGGTKLVALPRPKGMAPRMRSLLKADAAGVYGVLMEVAPRT